MKIRRTIAPAGAPLYAKDLVLGAVGMIRPAKAVKRLEDGFRSFFAVKHIFPVSSGKAALTLILQSLAEIQERNEVVIPSYTCFSVPSAVIKAGLTPVICDIGEDDINYDPRHIRKVIGNRTLCVLLTHLFGIPCDFEPVSSLSRSAGSFIIEDCAQALGVELNGRKLGTLGDVGFFSLGRGKDVSAVSAGIIITGNDTIAEVIHSKVCKLKPPSLVEEASALLTAIFLYVFSRPSLYWFPSGLPFLNIGKTIFSTDFRVSRISGFNAGLAADWRRKLDRFTKTRMRKAEIYKNRLKDNGFIFFREPAASSPAYLRFPLVATTAAEKERICSKLSSLGASSSYPSGIAEIPQLNSAWKTLAACHRGNNLAERIVTLPTHPQVSDSDIERIVSLLQKQAGAFSKINGISKR